MKNYFTKIILLLGVLAFVGTSCGDDEDDSRRNQLTINGESVTLTQGFIQEYGSNGNGSFDWDIYLGSEDFSLANYYSGTLLYLDLNSNSATGLTSGTYTWSSTREEFSIVSASLNGISTAEGVTGTVEVEVGTNQTSFDVNITVEGGGTITAYFEGPLTTI